MIKSPVFRHATTGFFHKNKGGPPNLKEDAKFMYMPKLLFQSN